MAIRMVCSSANRIDRRSLGQECWGAQVVRQGFLTGVAQVTGTSGVWRVNRAVFSTVLLLAACNGFPNPEPIREAEHKPEKYPTYSTGPAEPVIQTATQRWVVLPGAVAQAPAGILVPVAQSPLLALKWDEEPFSGLFFREPDGGLLEAGEIR